MAIIERLRCPLCRAPFVLEERALVCSQRHSFDLAKEGYVNLLTRKQVGGDTREMLQARRAFFEREHYAPLSSTINELVLPMLSTSSPIATTVLDAGCGEGYYLGSLQAYLRMHEIACDTVGLDLAKDGVRMAARRYPDSFFLVANLKEPLPICDEGCQVVLNIFAPRNPGEFARVLIPGGYLLIVIPGPGHLRQLRETFSLLDIQEHKQQEVIGQFTGQAELPFSWVGEKRIKYELELQGSEVEQAVMMTPNYWHMDDIARARVGNWGSLRTEVEFVCLVFQK